jgi:hypothetical protein
MRAAQAIHATILTRVEVMPAAATRVVAIPAVAIPAAAILAVVIRVVAIPVVVSQSVMTIVFKPAGTMKPACLVTRIQKRFGVTRLKVTSAVFGTRIVIEDRLRAPE